MDIGVLLVTRSPEVHVHGLFEVHKGPWFPPRNRGEWRWLRLLVVHVPSFHVVYQTLSLCVPVQVCIVEGAPGHNQWGVVETPLPAKSQGRTGDYTFLTCKVSFKARSHTAFKDVPPSTQFSRMFRHPHSYWMYCHPHEALSHTALKDVPPSTQDPRAALGVMRPHTWAPSQ